MYLPLAHTRGLNPKLIFTNTSLLNNMLFIKKYKKHNPLEKNYVCATGTYIIQYRNGQLIHIYILYMYKISTYIIYIPIEILETVLTIIVI